MAKQKEHEVWIYVRLSNDDSRAGESVSVENQKLMLTKHVKEMGWEMKEIYVDDGWSGTNQNRKNPQKTNRLRGESPIKQMVKNEVYIGNMVQSKSGTVSYKNSRQIRKPEDEWILAEGTHEPIIIMELWNKVQILSQKGYKPRHRKGGDTNLFVGIFYCADCGFKLRGLSERGDRADGSEYRRNYYTCGNYARSGKSACTVHCIPETTLIDLVIEDIRKHTIMVAHNEEQIIEAILTTQNSKNKLLPLRLSERD